MRSSFLLSEKFAEFDLQICALATSCGEFSPAKLRLSRKPPPSPTPAYICIHETSEWIEGRAAYYSMISVGGFFFFPLFFSGKNLAEIVVKRRKNNERAASSLFQSSCKRDVYYTLRL